MPADLPTRRNASGVPEASPRTFVPAWMRGDRGSDSKARSLGWRLHSEKRGATSRAGARRAAGSGIRAAGVPAKAPTDTLTRRPGQQIIICCPVAFVTPIPRRSP